MGTFIVKHSSFFYLFCAELFLCIFFVLLSSIKTFFSNIDTPFKKNLGDFLIHCRHFLFYFSLRINSFLSIEE
uniref:Putative secreted protein n=1 Tax=Lutzomyia longipalpis TaxID=7200 RepID=A0A7G3AMH8_LUTLO